jgi:hypothetical protein
MTHNAAASLQRARAALSEPHNLGSVAVNVSPPAAPAH